MSSIYEWLKTEIAAGTLESDCRLPDHADLGPDAEGWVPGAYESLLMRSTQSLRRSSFQNFLLALKVRKQILDPSEKNAEKEEAALLKSGALAVVDPLISFLFSLKTDKAKMHAEAVRLATGSTKRELVKVGIALLGVCGGNGAGGGSVAEAAGAGADGAADAGNAPNPAGAAHCEDIDVLLTLARHEEFTFYAAPALRALAGPDKVNSLLLPLCRLVDGWGKTAILYELNYTPAATGTEAAGTDATGTDAAGTEVAQADNEYRAEKVYDYLLRHGCENRLGPALNANLCATKGRLAGKLESICAGETVPDRELWTGICEIMWGLTAFDGVNDSLNDYKSGIRARDAFASLVKTRPELAELDSRGEEIVRRMR